jgi:hypothetical protein
MQIYVYIQGILGMSFIMSHMHVVLNMTPEYMHRLITLVMNPATYKERKH